MPKLLDSRYRIVLVSDSGTIPSLYVRFLDPIGLVTDNYAVAALYGDTAEKIALDADILVVQRWISTPARRIVQDAKMRGIPIVYETDDNLLDLPTHSTMQMSKLMRDNIESVLAMADLVICSTAPLARAMSKYNPRISIIENYGLDKPVVDVGGRPHLAIVNTDYFKLSGSKNGFFAAIADAVADLDYEVTFFGSVDAEMIALAERFPAAVRIAEGFVEGRSAFIDSLALRGVNVAAVPLDDTAHHLVKSDIKFLDFASLGIPGIFNNPRVYGRVRHGIDGYLTTDTQAEWFKAFGFFADPAHRRACGRAAREVVAATRNLPHFAAQLAENFASLLERTKGRSALEPIDGSRSGFFWQGSDLMLLHEGVKSRVTTRPVIAALIERGFDFIEPRFEELILMPAIRAVFEVRQLRDLYPRRDTSTALPSSRSEVA